MSDARLSADGDDRLRVDGDLDFASVPGIWPALERAVSAADRLTLSLAGVGRTNSAGLVMLLEAHDVARRHGCSLSLADVPSGLSDLARMSGCEGLISPGGAPRA